MLPLFPSQPKLDRPSFAFIFPLTLYLVFLSTHHWRVTGCNGTGGNREITDHAWSVGRVGGVRRKGHDGGPQQRAETWPLLLVSLQLPPRLDFPAFDSLVTFNDSASSCVQQVNISQTARVN